jgi:hypothetical protein
MNIMVEGTPSVMRRPMFGRHAIKPEDTLYASMPLLTTKTITGAPWDSADRHMIKKPTSITKVYRSVDLDNSKPARYTLT